MDEQRFGKGTFLRNPKINQQLRNRVLLSVLMTLIKKYSCMQLKFI